MHWRQRTLSPWLRLLAGFALLVFVAAQTLCFIHCHFGGGHGNSDAQPSCHGSAQAKAGHDDHDTPAPAPTTTCSTLKTMLAGADAPTVIVPQYHPLYLPSPAFLALDATEAQPKAAFFRQSWTRDWAFTPEVCLGPAFRCLAPPFLG
ncbi:MAG: hypothetical protein J0M24_00235 [Verrucomicrobia bacterium]|nr:hypothetical protein [Verrucomicrobiota bacterium]